MNAIKRKNAYRITVLTVLFASSLLSVLIGTSVGSVSLTFNEILRALVVDDGSTARLLVWHLRFPRVLTGGLVGVCLSLAGCLLQSVMRNRLASPSTVGVSSGAAFVGYLTLVAMPAYAHLLPIGAVFGAFGTTILIYALAWRRGVSPVRMILSGLAVSALFGAFNDMIRTAFSDSLGNASGFLVGGLNGATWETFFTVLPWAVVGAVICLFLPTKMNILMLGDETANTLGLRAECFRFLLIAVSSVLAGAAISAAGLIGFVGLIVPHIARLLIGADHKYLLPASALLGFTLVTVCDTIGRVVISPGEIPVSIILSLIGAPFFLWLLRSRDEGGV
jgi:iron complex transport system permease protein